MRYEITHTCGHISDMQLFGSRTERERKAEWLESQPCRQCKLIADMMLYNACDDVLRKHKAYK